MVLGLVDQIRPILIRRKAKVKLHRQLCQHGPDLHIRQPFANTAHGTQRERSKGSLLSNEFWSAVPSLGDELVWMSICLCRSLERVQWDRDDCITRNISVVDIDSFWRRDTNQAGWDGWVQPQGFVDDSVKMLAVLELDVVDVAVSVQRCNFVAKLLERFRILDELVCTVSESRSSRVAGSCQP